MVCTWTAADGPRWEERRGPKLHCFCSWWCGPDLDGSSSSEAEKEKAPGGKFTVQSGKGCVWASWGPLPFFLGCRFSRPWIRREAEVTSSDITRAATALFLNAVLTRNTSYTGGKQLFLWKDRAVRLWGVLGCRAWHLWRCNLSSLITALWHWHFSHLSLLLTHTHTCSNYNHQAITSFCQSAHPPSPRLTGHFGRNCWASFNKQASSSFIKNDEHDCIVGQRKSDCCFVLCVIFVLWSSPPTIFQRTKYN